VLIVGLFVGLLAGFAAGGRLDNLIAVRFRWPLLIFGALALRLGTEAALARDVAIVDTLRLPLLAAAYGVLAVGLWANRARPGMSLALVGIALNATAILVNGGFMPVWEPSLTAAGFGRADVLSPIHVILPAALDGSFFRAAGPLGDVIPVPLPFLRNVLSIGDVVLSSGLAFFLFAALVRRPGDTWPDGRLIRGVEPHQPVTLAGPAAFDLPGGIRAGTGLAASLVGVATLERPVILGGSGAGLASPTPASSGGVAVPALPGAIRGVAIRARHHPFVRLAVNGSFSALWTGQLISLLGDRVHQVALAALVYGTTNSAIAGALTFVAATLPNLLFGPLAGVLVDRWDQKRVLIVSDLLRAGIVLLIPVSVSVSVVLAYPLVFLLTTVSIFFRPARTAVIPRVVREDELVTANSATWMSETLADVVGYPLAGLFVAFLGSALSLAFWLDSVSYVASALLVVAVVIPPVVRSAGSVQPVPGLAGIRDDLATGWRFLRREPVLLANTLQAIAGQLTVGATIALMPLYAKVVLRLGSLEWTAAYAFIETAIGVGNLLGGFVIGLLGERIAKGRMVIGGYAAFGLAVIGLGLTTNLGLALGLALAMGVSNMVFIIPTQTLFQERTPGDMIGRVVGFRFSAVFGAMTFSMAASGILGDAAGVGPVLVAFGVITVAAGLAGLASRPLREA
jgi:DHA3 family macrolide efflux protein-like MFS transporter